ncbi:MAG: hypothetical protein ABEL97_10120 [Salinibacter sp.]
MDDTLEVRWFVDGAPPAPVVDWVEALGAEAETTRTDLYLVSDSPAMNVKLREGKVQTKHRIGDRTPITFGDAVHGVQERWVKWSFPTREQHHDLFDDDPTGLWVPVHKERLRREIDAEEQKDLLDHMIEPDPAEAKIELTEVRAEGQRAWTICMEAEGRPEALPGTLQQMGTHLFGQGDPPSLPTKRSCGYARWIQTLTSSLSDAEPAATS